MPAKKRIKYSPNQVVEVGNGRKQKPLIGEILDVNSSYEYTRSLTILFNERENRSRVIQYNIHFYGEQSSKWVYQEQILRAQPDPTQEELETRARELYGDDYL